MSSSNFTNELVWVVSDFLQDHLNSNNLNYLSAEACAALLAKEGILLNDVGPKPGFNFRQMLRDGRDGFIDLVEGAIQEKPHTRWIIYKKTRSIKHLELDLLENGLDFILSSLMPILEQKNKNDLKYSLLHISAGTELVLKEILKNKHWSLIFEKIDIANSIDLQSGDFQSVSFENIIKRLKNIAEIQIHPKALNYFKEIRKKRNRIEHFAFTENDKAIISLVSKVLFYLIELIKEHIEIKESSAKSQTYYKEIIQQSSNFEEYTNLALSKLKPNLDKLRNANVILVECPECYRQTLPLDGNHKCIFCGTSYESEDLANQYIENVLGINKYISIKDGGDFPLEECPACDRETLVLMADLYLCFACVEKWQRYELDHCNYCNRAYLPKESNIGMCNDCRDSRANSFMDN